MNNKHENLLVVERSALGGAELFQGLNYDIGPYIDVLLDPGRHRFVPRPEAEHDAGLKQLIPYFVICNATKVWCYRRGSKPGEKRLADNYSLGVGGHINDCDRDREGGIYNRAAWRELNEEIVVPQDARHNIVALLNDDSNPVGRVHLGLVHVLVTGSNTVRPRSETIRESGFKTRMELVEIRSAMESWSQMVLDDLGNLLARGRAASARQNTG